MVIIIGVHLEREAQVALKRDGSVVLMGIKRKDGRADEKVTNDWEVPYSAERFIEDLNAGLAEGIPISNPRTMMMDIDFGYSWAGKRCWTYHKKKYGRDMKAYWLRCNKELHLRSPSPKSTRKEKKAEESPNQRKRPRNNTSRGKLEAATQITREDREVKLEKVKMEEP